MKNNRKLATSLTLLAIFIVAITLILTWILNSTFLEDFYLSQKEKDLTRVFMTMEEDAASGDLYTEAGLTRLDSLCDEKGISLIVVRPDGTILITSRRNEKRIMGHLYNAMFGKYQADNNKYALYRFTDNELGGDYLSIWGSLPDGNMVFIESAIESIRDSVSITNRFLIIAGLVSVFIGIIMAFFITKRMLKPLETLTDISQRMSRMDFDVKYVPQKNKNEIDLLGMGMNEMSLALEKNITELKNANVELRRDIKLKEENELMRREFISNVSHELKTPVSLIMGYTEGLKEGMASSRESQDYYLDVILDETHRMDNLIARLLQLNELEYGKEQIQMARIDLSEIIEESVDALRLPAEKADVKIDNEVKNKVCVFSDEFITRLIVDNYITNAIRYSEGEKLVKISVEDLEDRVCFRVFNSCKGILEEDIKRIWDKFYRIDTARSRSSGGSGIGLSIVKAAADALGAGYGAKNTEGGVMFFFVFDKGNLF